MKNKGLIAFSIVTLAILGGLLLTPGCKKPSDDIGSDIGVVGGDINSAFLDTFLIRAITVRDDSIRSDRTSLSPLGSFYDPYFGVTTSSLYLNFVLNNIFSSGLMSAQVDSVVLRIRYASPTHFGNIGKYKGIIKVTVYKMTELMTAQTTDETGYSSQTNFGYINVPVGSATIVANPYDSVVVDGVTEAPHVRIQLRKEFGQNLLTGSSIGFASNENFVDYFRGLFIKVESVANYGSVGSGGFLYLFPPGSGTRLSVYYNDSSRIQFPVDADNSVWVGRHEHDYSSAISVFNPSDGENILLVQPLSGSKVKIHIPYIKNFNADKSIAINKAELVLPVYESYTGNIPVPDQLLLSRKDENDSLYNLADYIQSSGANGGTYDSDKKEYKFNITLHLQSVMSGLVDNDTLVLESANKQTRGNRVAFYGTQNPINRVKLRIYYTKLQ